MLDEVMDFGSSPEGELFSFLDSDTPLQDSRAAKAYWKARYGQIIKLRNKHDDVDQIIRYTMHNNTFTPLACHDLTTGQVQFFENGQEVSKEDFIKKIKTLIHFL